MWQKKSFLRKVKKHCIKNNEKSKKYIVIIIFAVIMLIVWKATMDRDVML